MSGVAGEGVIGKEWQKWVGAASKYRSHQCCTNSGQAGRAERGKNGAQVGLMVDPNLCVRPHDLT